MVSNIESRKIELITFIAALQQEEVIAAIENIAHKFKLPKYTNPKQVLSTLSETEIAYFNRPIRQNITVEELAFEQKWQPIDEKRMDAIVVKLAITEPIELLLSQLNP